jgi:hypothetical protein
MSPLESSSKTNTTRLPPLPPLPRARLVDAWTVAVTLQQLREETVPVQVPPLVSAAETWGVAPAEAAAAAAAMWWAASARQTLTWEKFARRFGSTHGAVLYSKHYLLEQGLYSRLKVLPLKTNHECVWLPACGTCMDMGEQ